MVKQNLLIENIPAILWGEKSTKIMVAVHGNMSNKTDVPIAMLAEEAIPLGYQVLSFDLPQHGDRKGLLLLHQRKSYCLLGESYCHTLWKRGQSLRI